MTNTLVASLVVAAVHFNTEMSKKHGRGDVAGRGRRPACFPIGCDAECGRGFGSGIERTRRRPLCRPSCHGQLSCCCCWCSCFYSRLHFTTSRAERWRPLASTPPGMPETHPPQYFGWGGRQRKYPSQYYYVLSDIADQYWLPSVRSASSRFHSAIRRHQFASVRQADSRLTRLVPPEPWTRVDATAHHPRKRKNTTYSSSSSSLSDNQLGTLRHPGMTSTNGASTDQWVGGD